MLAPFEIRTLTGKLRDNDGPKYAYDSPSLLFPKHKRSEPDEHCPRAICGLRLSANDSTGKERNSESGLDYFGARYYGSALGRFTSPDWSAAAEPVPYATLNDPQSLNLYAYVRNNPLEGVDPDGHDFLHTCTGAEQRAGKCAAGDIAVQRAKATTAQALTAVGNAIGKASDFLNTAPGIGLVAGMPIFAETGEQEETPALAEAEAGLEASASGAANAVARLTKRVNLPSWEKLEVDVAHISERHMPGGAYTDGRDVFLNLTEKGVLAAIQQAYGSATIIAVQGQRVLLEGVTKTGMTVQMWLNKAENKNRNSIPRGKTINAE